MSFGDKVVFEETEKEKYNDHHELTNSGSNKRIMLDRFNNNSKINHL